MDWYEFKQLIDLTCNIYFAKNKSSRDFLWKQFEAAVLYASKHYPYNLSSENKDDSDFILAKKFYKSWVQFSYPAHPGKKLQIIVAHRINCTFGVSFCLEKNSLVSENQKITSNSSAEAANEAKVFCQAKETFKSKGRAGFFKSKEVNDFAMAEQSCLLKKSN